MTCDRPLVNLISNRILGSVREKRCLALLIGGVYFRSGAHSKSDGEMAGVVVSPASLAGSSATKISSGGRAATEFTGASSVVEVDRGD